MIPGFRKRSSYISAHHYWDPFKPEFSLPMKCFTWLIFFRKYSTLCTSLVLITVSRTVCINPFISANFCVFLSNLNLPPKSPYKHFKYLPIQENIIVHLGMNVMSNDPSEGKSTSWQPSSVKQLILHQYSFNLPLFDDFPNSGKTELTLLIINKFDYQELGEKTTGCWRIM